MKRWLIAFLVIALAGVALLGLTRESSRVAEHKAFDEILAYEISGAQDVVVSVPGNVARLSVTTWAIVTPPAQYDPALTYTYALGVTAADARGQRLFQRDYFQVSRVSVPDLDGPRASADFVARLADGGDWVTDSRTTDVELDAFEGRGGRVRFSASGPGKPRLLLRIAFSQSRGQLERRVLTRSLDPGKRRLLVEGRASLGFGDLPEPAQQRALASWGRRIGALGSKGVDYVERRLLLGNFRPRAEERATPDLGIDIDAQHAAALNLEGPLSLYLASDRDGELEVADGTLPPRRVPVTSRSGAVLQLTSAGARTVKVNSSLPLHVRFQLGEAERTRQIGDFAPAPAREGKIEVGPDVRRQRYFRLHPAEPIRVHLARGQEMLGLTLRGVCRPHDPLRRARVVATWREQGLTRTAEADVTVTRSDYDRFADVGDASEAAWLQFSAPVGARDVELTGPADLAVSVWTREPMTAGNVIHPAYARELAEDEVFRNAPYQVRSWAGLVPDNADALVLAGRELIALTQVRIHRIAPAATAKVLPERTLLPLGTPLRRELLMPERLEPGLPLPSGAWTPIRGVTALRVEAEGPDAARLSLRYRLGSQPLGDTLRVLVDEQTLHEQPLLLASGTLERPLSPGVHRVKLLGLREDSEAYARAAPANGGPVVKSYSVFELGREGQMSFQLDQKAGETLKVVLFVVTEGVSRPFRLSYTVDGGRVTRRSGGFFRQSTEPSGLLEGVSGVEGSGRLWEASPSSGPNVYADAVGRAELRLGDDLNAGRRVVRIQQRGGKRAFVRAVVVGQASASGAPELGLWSAEAF